MKDLDEERRERENRDRRFTIGGQKFTVMPGVRQELVDDYLDWGSDPENDTQASMLEKMDALIVGALEPGQDDQWQAVRQGSEEGQYPLNAGDIRRVIKFVLEVTADRPTEKPSGSGDTPGGTGTSSTEKSDSPGETS